jgi:hypothetical protein
MTINGAAHADAPKEAVPEANAPRAMGEAKGAVRQRDVLPVEMPAARTSHSARGATALRRDRLTGLHSVPSVQGLMNDLRQSPLRKPYLPRPLRTVSPR